MSSHRGPINSKRVHEKFEEVFKKVGLPVGSDHNQYYLDNIKPGPTRLYRVVKVGDKNYGESDPFFSGRKSGAEMMQWLEGFEHGAETYKKISFNQLCSDINNKNKE